MVRLLAIVLGGVALAFFGPLLLGIGGAEDAWKSLLTEPVFDALKSHGAGVFAGLALVLVGARRA